MLKIYRLIYKECLFALLFLLISAFYANTTFAVDGCPLTVEPSTIPANFKGEIKLTIQKSGCKFQDGTKYTIVAYPQKLGIDNIYAITGGQIQAAPNDSRNRESETAIRASLDLAQTFSDISRTNTVLIQGKNNPGPWDVIVCVSDISSCKDKSNIFGTSNSPVTVTKEAPSPEPSASPDQPKIDIALQSQCVYQQGSSVSINVTNIQPNQKDYNWWWESDSFLGFRTKQGFPKSDGSGSDLIVNIPSNQTQKTGKRQFCIDIFLQNRTGQNCISLDFTPNTPDSNTACDEKTRGPSKECTQTLISACLEKEPKGTYECNAGQCVQKATSAGKQCPVGKESPREEDIAQWTGISTAIGCIHTDPVGLITDFFRLATGIGGGIAFLLMVFGAFEMITSAGNPETLKSGQQRFSSAIIGLLFVIFSVILLKIIGIDILGLGQAFGLP